MHVTPDYRQLVGLLQQAATESKSERFLITIDGPCGSGKSTLADKLGAELSAPVVHMDDFSIPHCQKTPQRLAVPGGNADTERLLEEFLRPWHSSGRASYRAYRCHDDIYGPTVDIAHAPIVILEGSYSNLPEIRQYASIRVFLTIDPEMQQQRLMQRVGPDRLVAFNNRWIPLECAYFNAYALPDTGCIVIHQDDHDE